MTEHRNHIDVSTLIAVVTLMLLSIAIVYSASASWAWVKFGSISYLMGAHAIKIFVGIVALFIGINIDYRVYRKITKPAILLAIGMLLLTLVLGNATKGATRWLNVAGFSLQPSEFAKFALVFHLSALIARKGENIRDLKEGYIPLVLWIGSVSGLVFLQPNFSTGFMILGVSMVILFVSRARFKHLFASALAMLPVVILFLLTKQNQFRRLTTYLSGDHLSHGNNYQLLQGIIGFGTGGLFGVGPGESKQRDFFLPESYGDFVFSIIGEEYGLVGTLFFISLFAFIMLRGFKIARHAPDEFGRLLAISITSMVALYAGVNAGVTLGIFPTTGLPMPFVSYGGSNLVFTAFAVGILLNISRYTELNPRIVNTNSVENLGMGEGQKGKVYS